MRAHSSANCHSEGGFRRRQFQLQLGQHYDRECAVDVAKRSVCISQCSCMIESHCKWPQAPLAIPPQTHPGVSGVERRSQIPIPSSSLHFCSAHSCNAAGLTFSTRPRFAAPSLPSLARRREGAWLAASLWRVCVHPCAPFSPPSPDRSPPVEDSLTH